MNLASFEKSEQEKIIQAEARAESEVVFAHHEVDSIKHKIEKKKRKQQRFKVLVGFTVLVVITLTCVSIYSTYKLHQLRSLEAVTQTEAMPKTGEEVLKALRRHILVPEGNPQIAEINDISKLKDTQAFFRDAENGDVVIVYDTTIFIYRPSADIVVASGDISQQTQVKP